ncbi:MAG: segregation/condensation protein A, partial [Planctomycetota bacterium]|nr:segregation/condensation protein A [Planctomycetota bacterium]
VEYDDTPISLHQADLVDRLAHSERRRMTMQQIFTGRSRGEMIGLFLALLELARQQQVAVRQDDGDADIEIELLQLSPEPGTENVSPFFGGQVAAKKVAEESAKEESAL